MRGEVARDGALALFLKFFWAKRAVISWRLYIFASGNEGMGAPYIKYGVSLYSNGVLLI